MTKTSKTTECPACVRLRGIVKCNNHRVESSITTLVNKARNAGFDVAEGDWKTAETVLNARPVVIS